MLFPLSLKLRSFRHMATISYLREYADFLFGSYPTISRIYHLYLKSVSLSRRSHFLSAVTYS